MSDAVIYQPGQPGNRSGRWIVERRWTVGALRRAGRAEVSPELVAREVAREFTMPSGAVIGSALPTFDAEVRRAGMRHALRLAAPMLDQIERADRVGGEAR